MGLKRSVDARGVFVAAIGLVLLGACFLPYYTVSGGVGTQGTFTVMNHAFGQWRLVLPALAVVTVVVGIANSVLRVGERGAVGVFYALRFVVLAQLALWVVVIFVHHFFEVTSGPRLPPVSVTVGWLAYTAAAVSLVGVAGSVSTMGTSDTA
ncbi:MAG: hypothetical protein ACYDHU_03480 [Acidimicrobiales bacterium]